jgi:hypothetical protein
VVYGIIEAFPGQVIGWFREKAERMRQDLSGNQRRIGRRLLAFLAVQMGAQMLLASSHGEHPRAIDEWGLMPYVLPMTTGQIGHPIALFVLVISNDRLSHGTTMLLLQMEGG